MKTKSVIVMMMLVMLFIGRGYAQNYTLACIKSEQLFVTNNKTTSLIFPTSIQSIDRGSKDILVQQPNEATNVVQLKANDKEMAETNLTIITTDGKLYSFVVDYVENPAQLTMMVAKSRTKEEQPVKLNMVNNQSSMQKVAEMILAKKPECIQHVRANQLLLSLDGIYLDNDVLYFRLQLKNNSAISYDVNDVKFILKSIQRAKRKASQESEIEILYQQIDMNKIEADSTSNFVIAVPKFTIARSKILSIQVAEKEGDRSMNLSLNNHELMKAL